MAAKIATVIGSTGLIGRHLIDALQEDKTFEIIRAVVRRPLRFTQPKVEMKLVNFEDGESLKLAIDGSDAVFCAVGTTQKKVGGDKEAYRKIDYDIPVSAARFCAETHCPNFLLVSSVGANSQSSNFYLRLKGEVEDRIKALPVQSISIFRPSVLLGKRDEVRIGEKLSQSVLSFAGFLLIGSWKKYRPVTAANVAKAMLQAQKKEKTGLTLYEYEDIRKLALN